VENKVSHAYICPFCGSELISERELFVPEGRIVVFKCPRCGYKMEVKMKYTISFSKGEEQ